MLKFRNLSFKHKLISLTMLTSTLVILMSSIGFITIEWVSIRQKMLEDAGIMAEIIGKSCAAALTFKDKEGAEQILAALQTTKSSVLLTCIYTTGESTFAEYRNPNYISKREGAPRGATESLCDVTQDHILPQTTKWILGIGQTLEVSRNITLDGYIIGSVYMMVSLEEIYPRMRQYTAIVLGIIVISSGIGYFLSTKLLAIISVPIMRLAEAMRLVSDEKAYSVRVERCGDDEVGLLINGFNQMLTHIEERDDQLESHRGKLKKEVEMRTLELSKTNSELRHTIQELQKAMKAAEAASLAKSQFVANMSHELRTPLNIIINFIEMILERHFGTLTEEQSKYLNLCHQSSHHLLLLINDVLDLSKVEAGKMLLQYDKVLIQPLFENIEGQFGDQSRQRGIQLDIELVDLPVSMVIDELKFKQILYNLISNAFKFTPDGGRITINARTVDFLYCQAVDDQEKNVYLQSFLNTKYRCSNSDYLWVTVKDTGIGMQPNDLQQIFNPFEQIENSFTRNYDGTGLGLTLSQSFIELHGGGIWAESDGENQGSRFDFVIPLQEPGVWRAMNCS
jgi:signal transduction histidine kinase